MFERQRVLNWTARSITPGEAVRRDIPALTSIRFLAASYVVLHHSAPSALRGNATLNHFLLNGDSSVELFFFLSGFILTYTNCKTAPVPAGRFYLLRFARIYPVYVVGLALFFPAILANLAKIHVSAWAVWSRVAIYGTAAGLLIQAWVPKWSLAWNGPGWSLSAEAFFYAVFPAALRRIRGTTLGTLLLVWPALWAWSAIPVLLYAHLPPDIEKLYWVRDMLEFDPLLRLPEFLGGMVAAAVLLSMKCQRLPGADPGAAIMLAIIGMTDVYASHAVGKVLFFAEFPAFLLLLSLADGFFSRLLSARPLVLLGGASYSIYILHVPLHYFFARATNPVPIGQPTDGGATGLLPMPIYVAYLATLIAVSVVLFTYFELPVSRALRSRWIRSAHPGQVVTS